MLKISNYTLYFILIFIFVISAGAQNKSKADKFVDALLTKMTLEEKLGQLNQPRGELGRYKDSLPDFYRSDLSKSRIGSFLGIFGTKMTRTLQKIAIEDSRLKIPVLFGYDVIHGLRTVFPVPLGEASSWDPAAVEKAARIAATEAAATGINWTFAPMVDIARDPRWGRIVEGSGEDPYLGSLLAAARVRGFQGSDLAEDNTVLACAKHFVAYGGAEGGRDYNTVDISERTLDEIYLPPFHAAVNAGVGSVMGGFDEIGGIPMHANGHLINGVLRGEWGFDGILISDFTAVMELLHHGIAADSAEAGYKAIIAGVDIDMVSGIYLKYLGDQVKSGTLSEDVVNKAVRRVLMAKYKLGLFDDPYRYCNSEHEETRILSPDHITYARQMARESMVLLKNENHILPLSKNIKTIAVIGPLAKNNDSPLGPWAGLGKPLDVVSVADGIKQSVFKDTKVITSFGCPVDSVDYSGFDDAVKTAQQADVVVLVLGELRSMSGEASSRSSLDLPGVQNELAQKILATSKPVVVVLMNGRPLSINWISENIPAVLEAWYPGVQAGPAIADILFGEYNPSGKLPVTFPRTVGQVPIYYNHKNTGRPNDPANRFTSKYLDLPSSPLFPFGWGLSYSNFVYSNLKVDKQKINMDDSLRVSVDVTNNSVLDGWEVVQVYTHDEAASVTPAVKELKRFKRVFVKANSKQTVTFSLKPQDLKFFGLKLEPVVEPGFFTVMVGGNSRDVLATRFELNK